VNEDYFDNEVMNGVFRPKKIGLQMENEMDLVSRMVGGSFSWVSFFGTEKRNFSKTLGNTSKFKAPEG
jgi:hypothetical protein